MIKTEELIFHKVNNAELTMRIFTPGNIKANEKRPAVIFFFGGAWRTGDIEAFKPKSEYLAERGIVCFTPEYRIYSKHKVRPWDCVKDAKAAVKWVRDNCEKYHVDPERIAVGGGSAGGHLALCTAMLKNKPYDGQDIWKIPKAMLLYNPAVTFSRKGITAKNFPLIKLLILKSKKISPMDYICADTPPAIIFHGTADDTIPYSIIEEFRDKMKSKGRECEIVPYEGRKHAFFHKDPDYSDIMARTYKFLTAHGWR